MIGTLASTTSLGVIGAGSSSGGFPIASSLSDPSEPYLTSATSSTSELPVYVPQSVVGMHAANLGGGITAPAPTTVSGGPQAPASPEGPPAATTSAVSGTPQAPASQPVAAVSGVPLAPASPPAATTSVVVAAAEQAPDPPPPPTQNSPAVQAYDQAVTAYQQYEVQVFNLQASCSILQNQYNTAEKNFNAGKAGPKFQPKIQLQGGGTLTGHKVEPGGSAMVVLEFTLGGGKKKAQQLNADETALAQQARNLLQTEKNLAKAEKNLQAQKANLDATRASLLQQNPNLRLRNSE